MQAKSFTRHFFARLTFAALALTIAGSTLCRPAYATDPAGVVDDATAAAKAWLVSMDHKEYETSYETGGALLHQQVSLIRWTGALQAIRENFGSVESRELTAHDYFPEGFKGSSGQFLSLEFTTKFSALKAEYTESIMMRRENGTWEVVGYRLSPPDPTAEQLAAQPAVEEDTPQQMEMNSPKSKPVRVSQGNANGAPQAGVPIESTSQPLPLPR